MVDRHLQLGINWISQRSNQPSLVEVLVCKLQGVTVPQTVSNKKFLDCMASKIGNCLLFILYFLCCEFCSVQIDDIIKIKVFINIIEVNSVILSSMFFNRSNFCSWNRFPCIPRYSSENLIMNWQLVNFADNVGLDQMERNYRKDSAVVIPEP